jgi:branched-subunit amino acid aminotransferase/4-amino-4-deoxychorismate lyase
MNTGTVWRWAPEECHLLPLKNDEEANILAADSWLVADGRVRGMHLHRERFFLACKGSIDIDPENLALFWQQAIAALPREGSWFPRVELIDLDGVPQLQLRVRHAPPLTRTVRMLRWPVEDPRGQPRRKGPDLLLLSHMRQQTIAWGADEALLTDPHGIVLEGLTSSVVWWEDGALCLPDSDLPVLPGTTVRLLAELAEAEKIRVRRKRLRAEALNGCTVWSVNALHGIRPVVQWMDSPWVACLHVDHAYWQNRLCSLAAHLDVLSENGAGTAAHLKDAAMVQ